MLHLFVYFILLILVFRDKESWLKYFKVSMGAAFLVILYGIGGAMGIGGWAQDSLCGRFSGSLGNPAYVGTYLIFSIFFSSFLIANEEDKQKKVFWILLTIFFSIFLIMSQTRGAVIGIIAGIIATLGYLAFTLPLIRQKIKAVSAIIVIILVISIGFVFRSHIDLMPFCKQEGGNRLLDISVQTQNYQTRLTLWKISLEAIKDYPIFGWGPENFIPSVEKNYDPSLTVWYDKAHSIYFDYLVTTGILGLVAFLSIFITFGIQLLRKTLDIIKNKTTVDKKEYKKPLVLNAMIFGVICAYLVQGLVLFDVLPIYISLFAILAFSSFWFRREEDVNNNK